MIKLWQKTVIFNRQCWLNQLYNANIEKTDNEFSYRLEVNNYYEGDFKTLNDAKNYFTANWPIQ